MQTSAPFKIESHGTTRNRSEEQVSHDAYPKIAVMAFYSNPIQCWDDRTYRTSTQRD